MYFNVFNSKHEMVQNHISSTKLDNFILNHINFVPNLSSAEIDIYKAERDISLIPASNYGVFHVRNYEIHSENAHDEAGFLNWLINTVDVPFYEGD